MGSRDMASGIEKMVEPSTLTNQKLRSNALGLSLLQTLDHVDAKPSKDLSMVSCTAKLVQPSTPPQKHRFDDLDLSPPPAPKKPYYGESTIPLAVIFCCDKYNHFVAKEEFFTEFALASLEGIYTAEYLAEIDAHSIDHLIELVPLVERPRAKRYFVFLRTSNEYREVGREDFEYFQKTKKAKDLVTAWFNCEEHKHGFEVSRFDCTEIEGVGAKKAELSPQQLSREKRQIKIRKISQGRKEDIQETARRLASATEEEIHELSSQLNLERKEEISEVARCLSSSKANTNGEMDLHLARVNQAYSESPLF